jgi:hypothetical protein
MTRLNTYEIEHLETLTKNGYTYQTREDDSISPSVVCTIYDPKGEYIHSFRKSRCGLFPFQDVNNPEIQRQSIQNLLETYGLIQQTSNISPTIQKITQTLDDTLLEPETVLTLENNNPWYNLLDRFRNYSDKNPQPKEETKEDYILNA